MVRRLLLILIVLYCPLSWAEANASISRKIMQIDETVMLTLSVSGRDIPDPDLSPLQKDFHIMGQSTSHSTRIINLKRTDQRQWRLHLQPKRTGKLTIPSIKFDDQETKVLYVDVSNEAPPKTTVSGMPLFLEGTVSTEKAYPQQEVLFTLRLFNGVPDAEPRSIDKLEIDNAIVKNAETLNYHKMLNGEEYIVWEFRYFIYPEASGTIEIPSLKLGLRVPHRTSYGRIAHQEEVLRSRKLSIDVQPAIETPNQQDWLTADEIQLAQSFSTDISQPLTQGDSFTRTILITAKGQMAERLPDAPSDNIKGVKIYPEKPAFETNYEQKHSISKKIIRQEILVTGSGTLTLPAIKVDWWNTKNGQFQTTTLDPVILEVQAATENSNQMPARSPNASDKANFPNDGVSKQSTIDHRWLIALVISLLANFVLLMLLITRKHSQQPYSEKKEPDSEKPDISQLRQAVKRGDTAESRRLTGKLMRAYNITLQSSNKANTETLESRLAVAIAELDKAIVNNANWSNEALADLLDDYIKAQQNKSRNKKQNPLKELYPE